MPRYFGLVTKNIDPSDWRYNSKPAQRAAKNEMGVMTDNRVWNLDAVQEWAAACEEHPDAEVVGAKLLIGIKDYEIDPDENYKARFVCTGRNIMNADGKKVWQVDSLYAAPVDLNIARLVILHGVMTGIVLQADVQAAYLQAPLGGKPTFLRLPRRFLPKAAMNMRDPVVPLLRAMYGHPRSGGDWDVHFAGLLRNKGWKESDGFKSLWVSPCGTVALAIYVDDMLVAGPTTTANKYMDEIKQLVRLSRVHELSRFLGTTYVIKRVGRAMRVSMAQPAYARLLIQRFKTDMGYAGPLRKVDTPITTDDMEDKLGDRPGRLAGSALTHLGGLLFLVRSSRPDLAYAVGFLTRYAANWSEASDGRLKRIFEYLESTIDHGVTWTLMRADAGQMSMKVFCDADHGGCADTARSTTGWNAFFVGPAGTKALVDWTSRRQAAAAKSTGEAEVVAGSECMGGTMPLAAAASDIFGYQIAFELDTDSDSARATFENGYSRKLRYIRKNQRVSIAFVADALKAIMGKVFRVDSKDNNSDIHTKPLSAVLFGRHKADLGVTRCDAAGQT
jgi:hypothetical protein